MSSGAGAESGLVTAIIAGIVAAVERSLFGGTRLGADDWQRARADYAGFALGGR